MKTVYRIKVVYGKFMIASTYLLQKRLLWFWWITKTHYSKYEHAVNRVKFLEGKLLYTC